jgi:hypothetical protein
MALRNRLLDHLGFGQALQYLSKWAWNRPELADLQAQLDMFDSSLTKDSKVAMYKAVDMSDPDACWSYLKNTTREDGFATPLLEILHLLMTIPSEQTTGLSVNTLTSSPSASNRSITQSFCCNCDLLFDRCGQPVNISYT